MAFTKIVKAEFCLDNKVLPSRASAMVAKTNPTIKLQNATSLEAFRRSVNTLGKEWVFRGQSEYQWPLASTLDRVLGQPVNPTHEQQGLFEHAVRRQVERFRDNATGRLAVASRYLDDDQILAIGQHYGLMTPLLDWTESPFVALFFAASASIKPKLDVAVWGARRDKLPILLKLGDRKLEYLDMRIDENPRILAQRGVFTRLRGGGCIEAASWNFPESILAPLRHTYAQTLLKIRLQADKADILRDLHRMNISWLTIFPDLEGAARHSNYILANFD